MRLRFVILSFETLASFKLVQEPSAFTELVLSPYCYPMQPANRLRLEWLYRKRTLL
jgi:hypothetical protein